MSTELHVEFQQLVQAAIYHADGLWGEATFDLYAPALPDHYGYLIASGMDDAIDAVTRMTFDAPLVDWLEQQAMFSNIAPTFFESLRQFSFDGDIWSVPEGSMVHANEPILQVRAPLHQACMLETFLVRAVSFSTGISTRAARMSVAAQGRPIIDGSSGRSANSHAALAGSRAAWIGGTAATTNVSAARNLGIPAWHQVPDTILAAYDRDIDAYEAYQLHFRDGCHVHLPDNDPVNGMDVLLPMEKDIASVRIDSEHLEKDASRLRDTLNRLGFSRARILGYGALDENKIASHIARNSMVDLFGVDSALATESATTRLNLSYRIAELAQGGQPLPIARHWAAPLPGTKQVVRLRDMDKICLDIEASDIDWTAGKPLLRPLMRDGVRQEPREGLERARKRCQEELSEAGEEAIKLVNPTPRVVTKSKALQRLAERSRNS